ncbi:MAG: hypothetical protein WDM78_11635 [Puia sp.]
MGYEQRRFNPKESFQRSNQQKRSTCIQKKNVKQSEIRAAFAIAKSISKKGQKGTPIAAPIVKVVGDEISAELDKSFLISYKGIYR